MSQNTSQDFAVGAYGEQIVTELSTVFQISAEHGVIDKVLCIELSGGTCGSSSSLFNASSGTNPDGAAVMVTQRPIPSRAGQDKQCKLSGKFSQGVANNLQTCGFISSTDALCFAFNGVEFGVFRRFFGADEIQTLTYTTPAAGAEIASVTVDGAVFVVPLTAGTVEKNAYETAVSLNSQTKALTFSSNGATVVALKTLAEPALAFAFTSATAVAAWVQDVVGVTPQIDFKKQSEWIEAPVEFDPTNGNEYIVQYDGAFGCVDFLVKDNTTCEYVKVYKMVSNDPAIPLVGEPSMRAGWTTFNSGNTIDITVGGSGCGLFVGGENEITNFPLSEGNTNIAVDAAADYNVLTFRNVSQFNGIRNLSELVPILISGSTDSSKGAIFKIIRNAQFSDSLNFSYKDKTGSLLEYAKDPVIVTGGTPALEVNVGPNGSFVLGTADLDALVLPGGTVTITSRMIANPQSSATTSLTYKDDL